MAELSGARRGLPAWLGMVAGLGLAIVALAERVQRAHVSGTARGGGARQESHEEPGDRPSGHSPNQHGTADEREHRRKERVYWIWSASGGILSALAAAFAAFFAYGAYTKATLSVGVSKRALAADHRTNLFLHVQDGAAVGRWIDADASTEGAEAGVRITISNFGQGPAVVDHAACQFVLSAAGDVAPSMGSPPAMPPHMLLETETVLPGSGQLSALSVGCPIEPRGVSTGPTGGGNFPSEHDRRSAWAKAGLWLLSRVVYQDAATLTG